MKKKRKRRDDNEAELDFPELVEQREIRRRRAEIVDAIKVSVRAGIKPPRMLVRYRSCLDRLQEWVFKKKLAEGKFDRYQREARRIERRLNGNERGSQR